MNIFTTLTILVGMIFILMTEYIYDRVTHKRVVPKTVWLLILETIITVGSFAVIW